MSLFPQLKLTYLDLPGRAEPVRLAFHIGGVPFEDAFITREELFGNLKPTLPYGQVPVLEVDGQVIAQSQGILRYAGRLAGLYPLNNPLAALYIDEVLSAIDDVCDKLMMAMREQDEETKQALRKEIGATTIPQYMALIDSRLAKQQELPVFQGDKLFIHHLQLHNLMGWIKAGGIDNIPPSTIEGYPHCDNACRRVEQHPKVREWYAAKESAKPKLKLTYLPFAGRAEPIRLAFHIGGVEFEDERIPHNELTERKPKLPYAQLPVLEVNGQVLAQSMAILRYAGELSGLYPSTDAMVALRIDEVFGVIDELYNYCGPSFKEQDEDKRLAMRKVLAEVTIPKSLGALNKRVGLWSEPFACAAKLTVADLLIYVLLDGFKSGFMTGVPPSIVDPFTELVRVHERVSEHPKVVEWNHAHEP